MLLYFIPIETYKLEPTQFSSNLMEANVFHWKKDLQKRQWRCRKSNDNSLAKLSLTLDINGSSSSSQKSIEIGNPKTALLMFFNMVNSRVCWYNRNKIFLTQNHLGGIPMNMNCKFMHVYEHVQGTKRFDTWIKI